MTTATAPALESRGFEIVAAAEIIPGARAEQLRPVNIQQPLFREGAANMKVIPIPTLPPRRLDPERPARRIRNTDSAPRRSMRGSTSLSLLQQDLFHGGETQTAPSNEVICCDAPVAVPSQRMLAAFVDLSLVAIAVSIVLGVFLMAGGEIVFTRLTTVLLVGMVLALGLFYRVLWVVADGDSPGTRFAGLRLVDFDGRRPRWEARLLRQAAGVLSVCSLGLGLVWALVDEESLTWHDHISKTFPTAG